MGWVERSIVQEYRKEVREKLKKQKNRMVEDTDKTLVLKGELRACNKILDLISPMKPLPEKPWVSMRRVRT